MPEATARGCLPTARLGDEEGGDAKETGRQSIRVALATGLSRDRQHVDNEIIVK